MPKRFSPKNKAQQQLRARFHDYNSQRRFRGQSTLTWDAYKDKTNNGKTKLRRK